MKINRAPQDVSTMERIESEFRAGVVEAPAVKRISVNIRRISISRNCIDNIF